MQEPPPVRIEISDTPDPQARNEIARAMLAYNETILGPPGSRPLAVLARSDDGADVIGGLWGRTSYEWLFIEILFLPEALRGDRIGEKLLRAAEDEAQKRGCRGVWLDTFSVRARRFYERQGYKVFGEIEDYPPPHRRYFMVRRFTV
jgi:GNAT superfamily N-acetyltransferase